MRLIFYIPYYRHGGVERVILSLITEISQQIDQVIVLASPSVTNHFQKIIPILSLTFARSSFFKAFCKYCFSSGDRKFLLVQVGENN